MTKSPLILIDVSGFIFRAYHALPPLTRDDGTPVGAVYGLASMLLKFLGQPFQNNGSVREFFDTQWNVDQQSAPYPGVIAVCDAGRETFRQAIYPDYKAHRPPPPEDLIPQFALCRDVCKAFHLPVIELKGYEADDVIATYASQATQEERDTIIVSADKDLMQLVNDHVHMLDPIKSKRIGYGDVVHKFGVSPHQVVDVQSLMGDSTDNVPGVPSVGPKTASDLIKQFGTLEALYDNIDSLKASKRKEMLIAHQQDAFISKQLVTLKTDVPLPLTLSAVLQEHTTHAIQSHDDMLSSMCMFFKEQGFKGLVKRMGREDVTQDTAHETADTKPLPGATHQPIVIFDPRLAPYTLITSKASLEQWCTLIEDTVVIDCETTSLDVYTANLVGIALATYGRIKPGEPRILQTAYIPIAHNLTLMDTPQMALYDVQFVLQPLLQNPSILKIGHNLKYDMAILARFDLPLAPYRDTMVMSYALDGGQHRHGLDLLVQKYFNHTMIAFTDVVKSTKAKPMTFADVPLDQALAYAGEDAEYTYRLYHHLNARMRSEKCAMIDHTLDQPLVEVLHQMEARGVSVDTQALAQLGQTFHTRACILEHAIYDLAGTTFNIASPKQISTVLFETMGLPKPKKTKTGSFTTDVDVLEDLQNQGYEIAAKIGEWRQLMKLISTYIEGLTAARNPTTGRIHTSYHQVGTTTGRLSSSEPNLQNIPIRSDDGRAIRGCFCPKEGFDLVSFDYSQIELRLLAHVANIDTLKQAFCDGMDIHQITAHQVFQIPLKDVTADQRRAAKAINFGIIYGMSAYGLSQQLKIAQGEARDAIAAYFRQYPGIQTYMEEQIQYAQTHGYVKTLWGRRCYTPGIHDTRVSVRRFAERQAINAPLQGSNADIIKYAMIRIHETFHDQDDVRMLMQVHDELVFEIASDAVSNYAPRIQTIMETSAHLSVPLTVAWQAGQSWLKM